MERVLRIPPGAPRGTTGETRAPGAALSATERGIVIHTLLERLNFRRPSPPDADAVTAATGGAVRDAQAEEIAELVRRFTASQTCARLGHASDVRREERFSFLLGQMLITGALDVLAREPEGRLLVVDYKSDRLEGRDPAHVVEREYMTQRLVYGLAALRTGAQLAEVVHVFLEAPELPVATTFEVADLPRLEDELTELTAGVARREFVVAPDPHRAICSGCPAEGSLCKWPLELTRRESPDQLF
jgi:hypothetical protein